MKGPRMEKSKPLISIGLPVFNEEKYLRSTLESLVRQTYANLEIIIGDNASTDLTQQICEEYQNIYPFIRYYRSDSNRGAHANGLTVLNEARGQYFMFAAGHDMWHPTFIEKAVEIMEPDPEVVLCYSRAMRIAADNNPLGLAHNEWDLRGLTPIQRLLTVVNSISGGDPCFGLVRLSYLKEFHANHVSFCWGQDQVKLAYFSLIGTIAHIPEPLFYLRMTDNEAVEERKKTVPLDYDPAKGLRMLNMSMPELWQQMGEATLEVINRSGLAMTEKLFCKDEVRKCFTRRYGVRWNEIIPAQLQNDGKNVLLVTSAAPEQTPFSTTEKRPPIGMGFLISTLRDAGHNVFFIDNYLSPSDFLETDYLQRHQIDYVGIYTNTICFRDSLRMFYRLEEMRQRGSWKGMIIAGGPHASVSPETIPPFVDHIVIGEGEYALRDIVAGQAQERIVQYPTNENLDELPMPAWDYFAEMPYNWGGDWLPEAPVFTMNTSRGCPFSCTFCSVCSIWGKRYTYFSAERVVADIEHVVKKFGARGIYFREDNFTLKRDRLIRFCQLMIERNIGVPWVCESRVSNLDRELVQLMARAGAVGFYFGVESGSQRLLDFLKKEITVQQIRNAFRWSHEFGIKTAASVIVGVPTETTEELQTTMTLLDEIKPTVTWMNIFTGIPHSKLLDYAIANGYVEFTDDRGLSYLQGHNQRTEIFYGNGWDAKMPITLEEGKIANPLISVVMSVHNGEKHLGQAIRSILNQSFLNYEFIIIDDASTDSTPDILRSYNDPRISVLRNHSNLGLTKSLNIGIGAARGKYIARMDADDLSIPDRFEHQVALLEAHLSLAVIGSSYYIIDEEGKTTGIMDVPSLPREIESGLPTGNRFGHGSVMMRKSCLEEVGGYNEQYIYAQDYDLFLRLAERYDLANIPRPLYAWRNWSQGISTARKEAQDGFAELARKTAARRRAEFSRPESGIPSPTADNPLISIIIPCFNQASYLAEVVESVVAQCYPRWECIIVNDGSPDDTRQVAQELIARYSDYTIRLIEKTNGGLADARNAGVWASNGKYVLFLDADDKIHSHFLKETSEVLQQRLEIGFVYTAVQHFGARTDVWSGGPFDPQRFLRENQLTCSALFRRQMYDQIGGLKTDMRDGFEDWEFWISGFELGWKGYLLDKPYFYYRKQPTASMLGSIYNDGNKVDYLKARIVSLHPKLYTAEEMAWSQKVLSQPDPFRAEAKGVETLKSREEIRLARKEMDRRGIDCLNPAVKLEFQKKGWIDGIGDVVKSWDVLKTVNLIEKNLPKDSPVLDIGSYCSEVPCVLARLGYQSVSGVDLNPELVNMPYNDRVRYHIGNFMETPFADRSFSAITAISVIEHGFDSRKLLAEVSRLLKPRGYFIASVDYWPDKIDTEGIVCFGLDWRIFSRKEMLDFIEQAKEFGLRPVGKLDFAAQDKTIDWMDRSYTFAWLALQKEDSHSMELPTIPPVGIASVIIAHTEFPFSPTGVNSGAEMATMHVARNLAASGITVKIFGILKGDTGTLNGVEFRSFTSYDALCAALSSEGEAADVVIANSVQALAHAARNPCFGKRLLWMHAPADSFLPHLATVNRCADAIIHVSRYQMALAEKTGFNKPPILLYNGFSETVFFPMKYHEPYRIIYAGALVPLKGVHLLVDAFPKIKAAFPEATLVICGSSAMWGEKPYLDEEHISRTVPGIQFLGAIPQNELARVFSSSSLGVIPTIKRIWQDPFPLTPVEMQACGLPVLVSTAGGLPESITDATGFVLDSEKPDEWANTIIAILNDQDRLKTMRHRCETHARERFRWQSLVSGLLHNLQNLDKRRDPLRPVETTRRQSVIAFLSTFKQPCGIATHTEFIIEALRERLQFFEEDECRIIVLAENSGDHGNPEPPDVLRCWQRNQPTLHRLLPLLLSQNVSILHIQFQDGLFSGTDMPEFISLCKKHAIKVFLTLHSSEHSLTFTADVINRADRAFTHLDQSIVRYCTYGADSKKIRVVPHGIHEKLKYAVSREEALRQLNLPPDIRLISSFGFFDKYKGVHEIIQHLPEVLRHHDAAFVFLGGGHPSKPDSAEYIRKCRALAEEQGISSKVLFMEGFLEEQVVSRFLSASDAIVMNYNYIRNEISGAAAFALSHRRPLITSAVPAFSKLTACTLQLSQGMNISQAINLVLGSSALTSHLLCETDQYISKNNYRVLAELLLDEYGISTKKHQSQSKAPKPLRIAWEGPQFIYHSMAHVNRELCLQLLKKGHRLSLTCIDDSDEARACARFAPLLDCVNIPLQADIHIRHWYPPDFSEPNAGYLVMIQPWEFGSVPKRWIEEMNRKADEVWVPSSYVRDCYIRSGMDPDRIAVVPNGIDTELFRPEATPLQIDTKKTFKFLYVGTTTLDRKGFDILIKAFINEFTDADDVCLVVKDMAIYSNGISPFVEWIANQQKNAGTPEIVYIAKDLLPTELAGLYTACDCFVHAYRGEGFCLPIAEAMAAGLPVIVTGHGACLDFCNDSNAYLIPAREVQMSEKKVYGMETVDFPWWAEPDMGALQRLLRCVRERQNEAAAKSRTARETIVNNFTWCHAVSVAEERLRALLNKPVHRLRPSVLSDMQAGTRTDEEESPAGTLETPYASFGKNILFISPILPTFDRDSGSYRLFQIIKILAQKGHAVTFIAMGAAGNFEATKYITALEELGVIVHPLDPERLAIHIGKQVNAPSLNMESILKETHFEFAYIYFYYTAALYLPLIRANSPHTSIIVDSVDFHFIRQKRNAELHNDAKLLKQAYQTRKQELLVYSLADSVIAVTEEDKKLLLTEKPDLTVNVIPNIHPLESVIPPCEGREGVLFIGNFFHDPNIDAVMYLCREIWPLVRLRLPDAKLYVVGNSPPEQIRNLAGNGIIVTGYVPDTGIYLRKCMVSVSPLRYGAGMKGKVGEALAAGIPVVGSTVAAEGTGLTDRTHVHIADDPASFAAAVIYLHENNEYWNHLSQNGNNFIRENYTPEAVSETVLRLFARKERQRQDSRRTPSANAPDNPYPECVKVRSPESEKNNVKFSGTLYCTDDTFSIGTYDKLLSSLSSCPDEEKITSIQHYIKTMPDSARAHNDLAVLYYQTGNKLQTLGHYEKALDLAPNDSTIRKNIASFYFVEMGRTDDAIRIYTDLLKESPDDTEVLTALGIISTTLGRADEAEIFLGKVVELEPWNHEARKARSGLTDTLGNSGYVTSATESMKQPVSIDENLAQITSNVSQQTNTKQDDDGEVAQKLLEEGRTEEAIALLENSLGNKPGDPVLHNDLGVLYQKIGNLQKSLEHYEIAVALSPENPLFQKNLASFIYVLLGKTDEAVNMYTDLLKNYPEDTEVLSALAIISSNNDRPEEACIFLKRVLELEPDNKDAHFMMQQLDPGFSESFYLSSRLVEQASGLDETSARSDCRNSQKDGPRIVSIVILTFNQLDKTRDCVDSIRRHTPILHEIIFVDNGSTDGTTDWLRKLCSENDNYTLIENNENRGFAAGCNQGIAAAIGEYVLLLNNDVIVTENWLDGLLECLLLTPDGGITGPMTNNISGIQQVPGVQYESVEEIDAFALNFREKNRHRRIPYRRIVGFCMLFRKNLVDAIGLLDENFGSGNFEDDDFCLRAELEGYRNVIAADVFIHHVGSATFKGNNIDFTSAMTGNRKVFNDKWSRQVRNENEAIKILTLKTLEKAESLYQRGETDKAIDTLLKEGISNASKEHRFYFALADYFIDQERFNDALDSLKELPDSAEGERKYVLLGRALAGMGNLEEAEKLAQLALQNDPSSAPALALSGRIAYDSGRQQEAISLFEAAIKANPGYGEPYTCLGLIALQEDRLEDAVNLLEKGFLYLPISAEAANHYHSLISASGKFDRAEDLFREMHRFYPQHRTLHFLLIDILIRQEKYQQAIAEIEEACTIFGIEDGMLAAGLDLRQKIGPLSVDPKKKKAGTSVSLCMIVKNEEKNLPRCLLSLKPIVDEIIIVDTGSTDRSRNLAKLFGAKVLEQPWNGDFSTARNVSLEQARGNWILVMDADEVISPHDHEHFRQLLKISTGKNTAFEITTRNYMTKMNAEHWRANDGHYPEQEAGGGWIPSKKVRLFTNLKTIRFSNPIHELVDKSLAQARIQVRESSIPVHHYGYLDKERQQEKGEQYYLLGIKKLAETGENDCTALSELAIQAGEIGRYAEAVELWSKVLCLAPDLPLAYFNLGFVYLQMGRFTESRDASAKAMKLKRNYYEAVNNYAMAELCLGNFQEASKVLKKTLTAIPEFPNAMAMLAVTRLYANKKDEGLKLFRKLSDNGVVFVEFIHESVKKLISAQRFNEARTILDTALANGYGNEKMHAINTSLQQGQ